MIETSRDILFLVIAFCVLLLTSFICWFIYYLIKIVKQANDMVKSIKDKIELFGNILESIHAKINSVSSYFPLITKGMSQLVNFVKTRRERHEDKVKNTTKKK